MVKDVLNKKLEELKNRVSNAEGIHCVIGTRYCSWQDEGYEDEFYIYSNCLNDMEIFYNRETFKYNDFNDMINSKIFKGKSMFDLINKINIG